MESQSHQLAAIMFTDIAGYTALMGEDELKAFELLKINRQVQRPIIEQYHGRWLKEIGDGILASFGSASDAVYCAIDIQKALKDHPALKLRIGVHLGEVVFEGEDVFGDGVNIASRLQAIAAIGSIVISEAVFNNINNKKDIETKFLKEESLKNVKYPVKIYAIIVDRSGIPLTGNISQGSDSTILQPERQKRPGSIRIMIITVCALLLLILTYIFYNRFPGIKRFYTQPSQSEVIDKSIAVLPFINLSNDPNQEYFSMGMMDEILNHLYKIGDLRVTSRTSSMAYKGSNKIMKVIARELNVAHLLEGSVQKDENRIRIIVQLIDGKTDEHLWSETYDRDFKDVFAIQSDVAQQVAANLKIKIDPDVKKRINSHPTSYTDAYDLLLKSRNAPFDESVKLLEKAISLDPNFAEAYSELASYWIYRGGHAGDLTADAVLKKALPLLQKALDIDPDLASGHINLAMISLYYKLDFDKVEAEYGKIHQLYPSNTDVIVWFTDYLLATGKYREALDLSTQAFQMDKNQYWRHAALSYYFNNAVQKSLDIMEETSSRFEKNDFVWLNYMRINVYAGKYEKAIKAFEKLESFNDPRRLNESQSSYAFGLMAISCFKTGQPVKAQIFLDSLIQRSKKSPVGSPYYFTAAAYTAMGKNDLALKYLEKAYRDHEVEMYWVQVEPYFRPLHGNPGFRDILKKVGFKD